MSVGCCSWIKRCVLELNLRLFSCVLTCHPSLARSLALSFFLPKFSHSGEGAVFLLQLCRWLLYFVASFCRPMPFSRGGKKCFHDTFTIYVATHEQPPHNSLNSSSGDETRLVCLLSRWFSTTSWPPVVPALCSPHAERWRLFLELTRRFEDGKFR